MGSPVIGAPGFPCLNVNSRAPGLLWATPALQMKVLPDHALRLMLPWPVGSPALCRDTAVPIRHLGPLTTSYWSLILPPRARSR